MFLITVPTTNAFDVVAVAAVVSVSMQLERTALYMAPLKLLTPDTARVSEITCDVFNKPLIDCYHKLLIKSRL